MKKTITAIMYFKDFKVSSGAKANGEDVNTVSATLTDGTSLISQYEVELSLTGSAHFSNGQQKITAITDAFGGFRADFTDNVAEMVTVTAILAVDNTVHSSAVAEFVQNSSSASKIALKVTVDNAKNDGKASNQVEVQTLSGALPAASVVVALSLNDQALFINGENYLTITTDSYGYASVSFTTLFAGEVTLTAFLPTNPAIFSTVVTHFTEAEQGVRLSVATINDNASANGKDKNQVKVTAYSINDGTPVAGKTIDLSVTGEALFDNGSRAMSVVSDTSGSVIAAFSDINAEKVTVKATADSAVAMIESTFHEIMAPLTISKVYNENKTFLTGEPGVAWLDACFYIDVAGGSGKYRWSSSDRSLEVIDNGSKTAMFRFINYYGSRKYSLKVTDEVTSETVEYSFIIDRFFSTYGEWKKAEGLPVIVLPDVATFRRLLDQWGSLITYRELNPPAGSVNANLYYWVNSKSESSGKKAEGISMINGEVKSFSSGEFCGFATVTL